MRESQRTTESTLVRHFLSPGNYSDLIKGPDVRRESTMYAKSLSVNDLSRLIRLYCYLGSARRRTTHCGEIQVVENRATCFPYCSVPVLLLTLV